MRDLGIFLLIVGIVSLVGPLVGFRLRQLRFLGAATPIVGVILTLAGIAFLAFSFAREAKRDGGN
jgi:uncharacterized membrane protein YgdD (TMEM256/DUF423 family)